MNTTISAKQLRASLPEVVQKVRRGARFTVLYRSQPAFQLVPVDAVTDALAPLDGDTLYRSQPVGRSTDGHAAADHDRLLYGR
jgi:antitoxin (DNA-binding transcriptional repressor) of toxin-antitoxin stability system